MNVSLAGLEAFLPNTIDGVPYSWHRTVGGDNINFTIDGVYAGPESRIELAESNGKYVARRRTVKFSLAAWLAGSFDVGIYPKPGDSVTVGGMTYTVRRGTDIPQANGLYRLSLNYFELQAALDDTISFLNPQPTTPTATGDRQVVLIAAATNIPCAIEPLTQEVQADHFGAKTSPEYFDVFLSRDVSVANNPSIVNAGALIQDQNGVLYEVMEVSDRERLDVETHLTCVQKL